MIIVTKLKDLQPGKWYAIGLEDENGNIDWDGAPLYKYEGEGIWTADDGEPAGMIWDAYLDMPISIRYADAYMLQA
jgi:hypothetical protein